ncbi:MAG: hypothetical protein R3E96_03765 [Planctomycetota bacterium]
MFLTRSALVRGLERAIKGPPEPKDLPDRRHARERSLTQSEIIEDVRLSAEQIDAVLTEYTDNLRAAARACKQADVPVLVCTVAVNWLWSGKREREYPWQGDRAAAGARLAELRAAGPVNDARAAWLDLVETADVQGFLGESEAAAATLREALERDPHQRRATVAQGERLVRGLAEDGFQAFDTTEALQRSEGRTAIGFDIFYDYVHFTPYGAARLAELMAREVLRREGLGTASPAAMDGYAQTYGQEVEHQAGQASAPDFLEPDRFLGIGFDAGRLTSTDLWKYEATQEELERRVQESPGDATAWVYLGDLLSFRQGQEEAAKKAWERAKEAGFDAPWLAGALQELLGRPQAAGKNP